MLNPETPAINGNIIALDVGTKRIGVARASLVARIAEPLAVIEITGNELDQICSLVGKEDAHEVIVGLPRGLDGQETNQTSYSRKFAASLEERGVQTRLVDEAGTSRAAEEYLAQKHRQHWPQENVDSLAAMIILQDYLDGLQA